MWFITHCQQIDNFVKFPPRQKAASFNLDSVMEALGPAMAREKAKEAKEAASEKQKPELSGVKAS